MKPPVVVFMGTPAMAIPVLEKLYHFENLGHIELRAVYTQPPSGRKVDKPTPVHEYAKCHGTEVLIPTTLRTEEEYQHFVQLKPDLNIVCAYGQILPQNILETPSIGSFNLHYSRLPRWRGASPIQSAILYGDATTGVSLQKMVSQLDAGAIVAFSDVVRIQQDDTYLSLSHQLSHVAADLLAQTLPNLLSKTFVLQEQDHSFITHCRKISKSDGLIDWQTFTADEIERKVRAFLPWPGAFTFLEKKRIQLIQVSFLTEPIEAGLVEKRGKDMIVGTRTTALRLDWVKPDGKSKMEGSAFLRGASHAVGTFLQNLEKL